MTEAGSPTSSRCTRLRDEGVRIVYQDRLLTCRTCGAEFVFTSGQQQFHETLGFHSTPRACKACRRDRDGAAPRARRPAERRTHPVRCSACGAETTVPFVPDPRRAAFCPTCYTERLHLVNP